MEIEHLAGLAPKHYRIESCHKREGIERRIRRREEEVLAVLVRLRDASLGITPPSQVGLGYNQTFLDDSPREGLPVS